MSNLLFFRYKENNVFFLTLGRHGTTFSYEIDKILHSFLVQHFSCYTTEIPFFFSEQFRHTTFNKNIVHILIQVSLHVSICSFLLTMYTIIHHKSLSIMSLKFLLLVSCDITLFFHLVPKHKSEF